MTEKSRTWKGRTGYVAKYIAQCRYGPSRFFSQPRSQDWIAPSHQQRSRQTIRTTRHSGISPTRVIICHTHSTRTEQYQKIERGYQAHRPSTGPQTRLTAPRNRWNPTEQWLASHPFGACYQLNTYNGFSSAMVGQLKANRIQV